MALFAPSDAGRPVALVGTESILVPIRTSGGRSSDEGQDRKACICHGASVCHFHGQLQRRQGRCGRTTASFAHPTPSEWRGRTTASPREAAFTSGFALQHHRKADRESPYAPAPSRLAGIIV